MGRTWTEVKAQKEVIDRARGRDIRATRARARARTEAFVVGYRLAELRKRVGLTQTRLAELMRVSQSRISQMERGNLEQLEIDTVNRYVAALGMEVRLVVRLDEHDDESLSDHLPPSWAVIA